MSRKLVYLSAFIAFIAFVFYSGPSIHGQDDPGSSISGQKKTGYVKSDESTTGETESEPGSEAGSQPGSPQGALSEGDAARNAKPPSMDSDYLKEVPKDFNLNLPPPTAAEIQAAFGGAASTEIGMRLLAASYHYLGVPYKLGGDGVRTTDCSMFTRMSAIRAGLQPQSFRRGAGIQYGYGLNKKFNMILVSKGTNLNGLQPGDFVFYNWRNEFSRVRPYGIGHVGLYVGPTKGKAIYTIEAGNPVNKGWRNTKYLVGFGRIVK